MRFSTLEIRWHDTKPIFSCDFQPFECVQHKKQLNPYQRTAGNVSDGDGKLWRVATAGGDNNVRIWLAIPNPPIAQSTSSATSLPNGKDTGKTANGPTSTTNVTFGKPKVEYLATLDRHTLTVNVVRFSPAGHLLATAGDDSGTGGILIWRLSANPATATFGSRSAEDAAFEKEAWQAIKMIKSKSPEIYDMAWSPDGQYLLAGGTDGAARVHRVSDGACVAEMLDHKDWVQGVAWDPLNRFIATQGKDRQMMVYSLHETPEGNLKVNLISKNARLVSEKAGSASTSTTSTSSSTVPLPMETSASALTSASISTSREGPKPLPVVTTSTSSQVMFSDEESTPFFRRLAFSTDGALLVTPAGQYEDPSGSTSASSSSASSKKSKTSNTTTNANASDADASVVITSSSPVVEKKSLQKASVSGSNGTTQSKLKGKQTGPSPTSYIFARGQLANETPIAHLPGHRTASIVVKFNPVLWDLRSKKTRRNGSASADVKGKGKEKSADEDENSAAEGGKEAAASTTEMQVDDDEIAPNQTTKQSVNSTEDNESKSLLLEAKGIFNLKQRTIYAVATHDTILVYDTQQESPISMFSSLHFAAFTDLAWTADGLTLIATSSDGYASIFTFEEGELGKPSAEQPKKALGPLEEALINGVNTLSPTKPSSASAINTSNATSPAHPNGLASVSTSKSENGGIFAGPQQQQESASAAATVSSIPPPQRKDLQNEDSDVIMLSSEPEGMSSAATEQPKKVKKRVALTHVGPLGS